MWRDHSPGRIAAGAARLLVLELRLVTGGRALLILGAQLAWLAGMVVWQHFRSDPWDPASFYNRTIVAPSLLPALALGMSCILAERDDRHLEMSFASPGGRLLVWCFRMTAVATACAAAALLLAVLTHVFVGREVPFFASWPHAIVPILFTIALAVFLSLLFNGPAPAGLVTGAMLLGGGLILHAAGSRFDPFMNPFVPPRDLRDPHAFLRLLTFNRLFLLTTTGCSIAGALGLLQRRERLL
jgi:hypothetical protein